MGQGPDLLGSLLRIAPERTPLPIDPSTIRRVLIVKLSSIGDVVQSLPVASAFKQANPQVHLAWVVDDSTAPLVHGHRQIERVITVPTIGQSAGVAGWCRSARGALRELRRDWYDIAIDLQGLARSAIVSRAARARWRIARAGQREGAHLVSRGVPLGPAPLHAVEEYLLVARFAGAASGHATFDLPVDAGAARRVDERLAAIGLLANEPLLVIAPSTSGRWKNWPVDRWSAVVDGAAGLGRVILVGTAADRMRHAHMAHRSRVRVTDWTGETTLAELIALLQRTSLHIAHDGGSAHIAAALGTPVVAVYGPTRVERLGPYGQEDRALSRRDLCGAACPAYCMRRRRCLHAIQPGDVIERARQVLEAA
jgi:lipopolysaccharide heptosyltransferase I